MDFRANMETDYVPYPTEFTLRLFGKLFSNKLQLKSRSTKIPSEKGE